MNGIFTKIVDGLDHIFPVVSLFGVFCADCLGETSCVQYEHAELRTESPKALDFLRLRAALFNYSPVNIPLMFSDSLAQMIIC